MLEYLWDGSSHNGTRCHIEIEVSDQTFYLTQSQYTDTGWTSTGVHPNTTGAWEGGHWSHWYDSIWKKKKRYVVVVVGTIWIHGR